jgi:nucleotide-binding universal stress UspA family protein
MTPLRKILFPTDFSNRADEVMMHAAFLARETGAELHVLHVYDVPASKPSSGPDEGEGDFRLRVKGRVKEICDEYGGSGLRTIAAVRTGEAPAPVINEYAHEEGIDLIVLGTHGHRGLKRMFMGSVAEEVIRSCTCPVYCIRQKDDHAPPVRMPNKILVPTDFSEFTPRAISAAKRLSMNGSQLHIVHVIEDLVPPAIYGLEYPTYHDMSAEVEKHAQKELGNLAAGIMAEGVTVNTALLSGYPASAITDYANDADIDLIVLTTHGRSGIERLLLGSVTEKVLRTSDIPVLIVRSFEPDQS